MRSVEAIAAGRITAYVIRRTDDGAYWTGAAWTARAAFSNHYESMSEAFLAGCAGVPEGDQDRWHVQAV